MEQTSQLMWERLKKFTDNFGTHSKNVGNIEKAKDPQERRGALKSMFRSDTAKKPVQANIQGVLEDSEQYFFMIIKEWVSWYTITLRS